MPENRSSVESGDGVLILRRAYYHIAVRDMSRRMWYNEFARKDNSVYPLTWPELNGVEEIIGEVLKSLKEN